MGQRPKLLKLHKCSLAIINTILSRIPQPEVLKNDKLIYMGWRELGHYYSVLLKAVARTGIRRGVDSC